MCIFLHLNRKLGLLCLEVSDYKKVKYKLFLHFLLILKYYKIQKFNIYEIDNFLSFL